MADIQYPAAGASTFTAKVVDNDGDPSAVLDASKDFTVKCRIDLNSGDIVTGEMTATVFADELGGSFDEKIGAETVSIPGDDIYDVEVKVTKNTLPENPTGSGIYRMAALLTHKNDAGNDTELTAFEDLGTFRVS